MMLQQNAQKQESPLLQGFKRLMGTLAGDKDLKQMDTLVYVEPFLEVIRSEETSGPITGVALSSMNKFLRGFIRADSPNAPRAMALIAEAVTNCR
jgi:golgi-specific brefeldin A-resistance guanine nucleotide exchange factor 1